MAWLGGSLGEGFSNLKGQLSKITKEVLQDDGEEEKFDNQETKIKELEAYCASQNLEIASLREENTNLAHSLKKEIEFLRKENKKLRTSPTLQEVDFAEDNLQSICKLENDLVEVTAAKEELEKSLEDLELQHQESLNQLLIVKDDLKQKLDISLAENVDLKKRVNELALEVENKSLDTGLDLICSSEKDNEILVLNEEVQRLQSVIEKVEAEKEAYSRKINELLEDNLDNKLEKLVNDVKLSEDEKLQLEYELNKIKAQNDELIKQIEELTLKMSNDRYTIENIQKENKNLVIELKKCNDKFEEQTKLFSENQELKYILNIINAPSSNNFQEDLITIKSKLEDLIKNENEKSALTNKIQELSEKLKESENSTNSQIIELDELKEIYNELKEEILKLEETIEGKNTEISELNIQLENTRRNSSQTDDVKRLEQEGHVLKQGFQSKVAECEELNKLRKNLEKEISVLKSMNSKTEALVTNLTNEKEQLENDIIMWKSELQKREESNMNFASESSKVEAKNKLLEKQLLESSKIESELKIKLSALAESNKKLSTELELLYLKADKAEELQNELDKTLMSHRQVEKALTYLQNVKQEDDKIIDSLKSEIILRQTELCEKVETINKLKINVSEKVDEKLEQNHSTEDNNDLLAKINAYQIMEKEFQQLNENYNILYGKFTEINSAYELLMKNQEEKPELKEKLVAVENMGHRRSHSDVDIKNNYEAEIVRLKEQLKQSNNDGLLSEKMNQLNLLLLQEQQNNKILQNKLEEAKEKEQARKKELERLKIHLVEVEEHYTTEAMKSEQIVSKLREELSSASDKLKNSSTAYRSASIQANQHVESLQSQVKQMALQRDDLQAQISAAEDEVQKYKAALSNFQIVLEQFQQDRDREKANLLAKLENEQKLATKRHKELENEIADLNQKLNDAKDGLSAAARLGEQLDKKTSAIKKLDEMVESLQEKLKTTNDKLSSMNQTNSNKVDKSLVKNLIVGYVSTNKSEDKVQVLKIMASVLDFNQDERNKTGVDLTNTGWLGRFIGAGASNSSQQSLAEAFIKFLETESLPEPHLKLSTPTTFPENNSGRRTPAVTADLVLPTFSSVEFQEGSILKDVLRNS